MKIYRYILASSLLWLFILSTCIPGSENSALQSIGSCSGVGLSGNLGGEEGETGGYDAGYPIDIPAPIAKNIEGVDATSIQFTPAGTGSNITSLKQVEGNLTTVVGIVSASLIEQELCEFLNVGIVVEGAIVSTVSVGADCRFEYNVDESLLGVPVALVVFEIGSPPDAGGSVSYPVIVTVEEDEEVFNGFAVTVHITNTDADTQDNTQADIQMLAIDINSSGLAAFSATNVNNAPFVGTIEITGGGNELLNDDIPNLLEQLTYSSIDLLLGTDIESALLYSIDTSGTLAAQSSNDDIPADHRFSISPNGEWIAGNLLATTGSAETTYTLYLTEPATLDPDIEVMLPGGEDPVVDISFDWVTNTLLIVIKEFDDGTFKAQRYDVSEVLDDDTTSATITTILTSSDYMGNPVADRQNANAFFYECENETGRIDLCESNLTGSFTATRVSKNYDVTDVRIASDSAYVTYEGDFEEGDEDNRVGLYFLNVEDSEGMLITKGFYPAPAPANSNHIGHLSFDLTGEIQVSLINLGVYEFNSIDADLPQVISTSPTSDATGVGVAGTTVSATFDEPINDATVTTSTFLLTTTAGEVDCTVGYNDATDTGTLTPDTGLVLGTVYNATVSNNIRDIDGFGLAEDYSWSFTTQTGSWGTPELIEADNSGFAFYPQVAVDSNQNVIAVWQQSDGTSYNIETNRYDANSDAWDNTTTRIDTAAADAMNPQVAMDASGNAIAVWYQDSGSGNNSIYASRYTAAGDTWGAPQLIENSADEATDPQIAIDSNGNAVAVWVQDNGSGTDQIFANRYTGSWGTASRIDSSDGDATAPQIAFDGNNNAFVVWYQNDGSRNNIWAARYDTSGGWQTPTLLEEDNASNARDPQIAAGTNGSAMAIWRQDGNIWVNFYKAGWGWQGAELVEENDEGAAFDPQIAFDRGGNAIAVWEQSDETRFNVWANRFDGAGESWATPQLIEAEDDGSAYYPQVGFDDGGNALVVWQHSDGTRFNIMSNRYTGTSGWGDAALIETDNTGGVDSPQIAVHSQGYGMAVWAHSNGTVYNIQANRFE